MTGAGRRAAALVAVFALAGSAVACGSNKSEKVVPKESGTTTTKEQAPVRVEGQSLPTLTDGSKDPAVGRPAPVLIGQDFAGRPVRIGPGSATLVVFLAHWCPHCNKELPLLVKWMASGQVPAGLEVVAVATGTNPNYPNYPPSRWLQEAGWKAPVLVDSAHFDAATAYGLDGYPFFAVLKADGTVAGRSSGEVPIDQLTSLLQRLLGGA